MTGFFSTRLGQALVGMCLLGLAVAAWLFVSDARHRGMVNSARNGVRQIWLGLQNYDTAKGRLPPAVYRDADGKPLSSWRFQIAPYMESLGCDFDLKIAWDGSANAAIRKSSSLAFDVDGFERGGWEGERLRMAAIGIDGRWGLDAGKSLKELPGTTLLAISAPIKGTHWMEPSEVDLRRPLAKEATVGGVLGITRSEVVYLLFADGRFEAISSATPWGEIEPYLPAAE